MAHDPRRPDEGYSPDMDGKTHETTYGGFVHFTTIGTLVVTCIVVALALGGVKGAWMWGIFGVVAASAAGTVGAISPRIGWRAPTAVLVLLAIVFVLA